ncbi:Spectrin beta chain, non-erythrocytic 5 [Blomia tropicalis]|nr:Spectrin beta chain, non-erythrocytic 5 [Blomia tropicalis]
MSFTGDFIVDSDKFERLKIGKLRNDREAIQEKTYKNWINSILLKAHQSIEDLYVDLQNGQKLILLLELITGEKISKSNKGTSLLHKIENVSLCLHFIKNKNVYLESIGPEDIVHGNRRLTLGLIWTIILRFQLSQNLQITKFDLKSVKDSLLVWCQSKTCNQNRCNIIDFNRSWIDGWAFIELIRSFRSELIHTEQLMKLKTNIELLERAFEIASEHLLIPKILDAEDVVNSTDENSILTYVSYFYNLYCKMKTTGTSSKRVKYILTQIGEVQNEQNCYEQMVMELLTSIREQCTQLQMDVDINQVHNEMGTFNEYFKIQRPTLLKKRNDCESTFFDLLISHKKIHLRPYVPKAGFTVNDIERSWQNLERAETERQARLKKMIVKWEHLCKIQDDFESKCFKMEKYISDKLQLLNKIFQEDNYTDLDRLEVHLKQSDFICCDILSNSRKFDSVFKLSNELIENQFKNWEFNHQYTEHLRAKLEKLSELAVRNQNTIQYTTKSIDYLRQMNCLHVELERLNRDLSTMNVCWTNATQCVFVNLEKLKQHECYLRSLERQFINIQSRISMIIDNNNIDSLKSFLSATVLLEPSMIKLKFNRLNQLIVENGQLIDSHKSSSHSNLDYNEFQTEIDFIQLMCQEKELLCRSRVEDCYDQNSIVFVQRRNNITKLEVKSIEKQFFETCERGYRLISRCEHYKTLVNDSIEQTKNQLKNLIHEVNERTILLNDSVQLLRTCQQLGQFDLSTLGENYGQVRDQVYTILKTNDELSQIDLLELIELMEQINQLNVSVEQRNITRNNDNGHVIHLKQYTVEHCLIEANHAFLVLRVDQPIHFLCDIYVRLLRTVGNNFRFVQQLLIATECDTDRDQLRHRLLSMDQEINDQPLSTNHNHCNNLQETEQIYDLLLSNDNLIQFIETLRERHKRVQMEMQNMHELMLSIRNSVQLLKVTRTFARTFVRFKENEMQPNSVEGARDVEIVDDNEPVEHEEATSSQKEQEESALNPYQQTLVPTKDDHIVVNTDIAPIHSIIKDQHASCSPLSSTSSTKTSSTTLPLATLSSPTSEREKEFRTNLNRDAFKLKVVTYKLRHNVNFIGTYLLGGSGNLACQHSIFGRENMINRHQMQMQQQSTNNNIQIELNLTNDILRKDMERIDSLLKQIMTDVKATDPDGIGTNTTELNRTNEMMAELDRSGRSMDHKMKLLQCMESIHDFLRMLADNIRTIETIDVNHGEMDRIALGSYLSKLRSVAMMETYYKDVIDECSKSMSSMEEWEKKICQNRIIGLKRTFAQFEYILSKKNLECRQRMLELDQPQTEWNQLFADTNNNTDTNIVNPMGELISNQEPKEKMENLEQFLREIELILFEIESGCDVTNVKYESIISVCDKVIQDDSSHHDSKMLKKLAQQKDRLVHSWTRRSQQSELERFNQCSSTFVNDCKRDIDQMNVLINEQQLIPLEMVRCWKQKYIQRIFEYRLIREGNLITKSAEIGSRLIFLCDLLERYKGLVDKMEQSIQLDEEIAHFEREIDRNQHDSKHLESIMSELDELLKGNPDGERKIHLLRSKCFNSIIQNKMNKLEKTAAPLFESNPDLSVSSFAKQMDLKVNETNLRDVIINNWSLIDQKIDKVSDLIQKENEIKVKSRNGTNGTYSEIG